MKIAIIISFNDDKSLSECFYILVELPRSDQSKEDQAKASNVNPYVQYPILQTNVAH